MVIHNSCFCNFYIFKNEIETQEMIYQAFNILFGRFFFFWDIFSNNLMVGRGRFENTQEYQLSLRYKSLDIIFWMVGGVIIEYPDNTLNVYSLLLYE